MDDKEKNNILYRPSLKPDERYLSDGVIPHKQEKHAKKEEPPKVNINEKPKEIIKDLDEIINIMELAPQDVAPMREIEKKLKARIQKLFPNGTMPEEEEPEVFSPKDIEVEPVESNVPIELEENIIKYDLPELFPSPSLIELEVEEPKTIFEVIQDGYIKDNINLVADHIQQIQLILQKYFQQMFLMSAELGVGNISELTNDFDGTVVKIPAGQDLEHCRDHIVRSQQSRIQKTRLFRKTHSSGSTLQHIRAWHVAAKQRERYYSEKYGDSYEYIDSHSNTILRESRNAYNKKYKEALMNMYKFLNSAASVTDDILTSVVKETQAKGKLAKHGVEISMTAEYLEAKERGLI